MRFLFLAVAAVSLTGCGYPGGPLAPLANIPAKITDLSAVQRGDSLIVRATLPAATTELQPIPGPLTLEMRAGPAPEQFRVEDWAPQARLLENGVVREGIATWQVPVRDWVGKVVVLAARTAGGNRKPSDWSNFAIVPVIAPPPAPAPPGLETTPLGVRVMWPAGADQMRIYRRGPKEETFSLVSTVPDREWTDTAVEYGSTYIYRLQSLMRAGTETFAESGFSPDASIVPSDKFAPAVPNGLHGEASGAAISLGWEGNTEPDLAGYRVYRSVGDGEWQKVADTSTVPSYNDAAVEAGKRYRYAVSALDGAGNESARSASVDVTL